jgi:DNA-binding GntR family transcriptional regulator
LRTAVTSREIEPGSRLVETELSAAMGISRGTLREALRQLEYEGLIEVGERGRLTIRTLTDAELADMFSVRAALEGLAAAELSTRPDRDLWLGRLQAAVDALGAAGGSIGDLVEVDLAFHRLLCELTGNATLVRAWETLTGPIRVAILFAGPEAASANMAVTRHQQLLDAIGSGEPVTAMSAVDAHMRAAARTLLARGDQ